MWARRLNAISIIVSCSFLSFNIACYADQDVKDVNILFYGRVINQFNEPIPDANVHAKVSHHYRLKPEKTRNVRVKTDNNGFFEIVSKGCSLYVEKIEASRYKFLYDKFAVIFESFLINCPILVEFDRHG